MGRPLCVDRLVLSSCALNQTGETGPVQCQTEGIKGEHFKEQCWKKMWESAFEKTLVFLQ